MSAEVVSQAEALMARGRYAEAAAVTEPLARRPDATHRVLAAHTTALKAAGRRDEALAFDEQAVARFANEGVAWHNYAATLGDLGRGAQARAACERAFALGLDVAPTWGIYARALLAVGEHDAAERAYRESLKRDGRNVGAAAEYANVVWMRRGDLVEAEAVLDDSFRAGGAPGPLLLAKAKLFEGSGDIERAAQLLTTAAAHMPRDMAILLAAAQASVELGRLDAAERWARQAEALGPHTRAAYNQWAIIHLAAGRPDLALAKARAGLAQHPFDQSLTGWAVTAARALGDPLYRELVDYDTMVGVYDIETPQGWASLPAFLADLAPSLSRMHVYANHPTMQSLRQGSQTMHFLAGSDDPAIRAFFQAVDAPIRRYMAGLGKGDDLLRRRNTGDYRISGAWSVLLRPGGFHRDHFHPEGWLSSAFYVETPDAALAGEDKAGWLRFGQPPFATVPPLPPEHFVRPKPGRLVLFPSYLWHGTVPFETQERRLTVAFDAVPR